MYLEDCAFENCTCLTAAHHTQNYCLANQKKDQPLDYNVFNFQVVLLKTKLFYNFSKLSMYIESTPCRPIQLSSTLIFTYNSWLALVVFWCGHLATELVYQKVHHLLQVQWVQFGSFPSLSQGFFCFLLLYS